MPRRKSKKVPIPEFVWQKRSMWAGLVFGLFLVIYAVNLPSGSMGYGNGDILLVMGNKLGVAQPPGYPIYVCLLHLFSRLPLNTALTGHLLSAVMAALTLTVVFLIGWDLYELAKIKRGNGEYVLISEGFERWLLAWLATLTLGFSGVFWVYAQVTERYMFSALLMALVVWQMVLNYRVHEKARETGWVRMITVLGLAMSHQWIFWLILPVLLVDWYFQRAQFSRMFSAKALLLLVGASVLPFVLLLSFKDRQVPYSYLIGDGVLELKNFVLSGYVGDGLLVIEKGAILPDIKVRLVFANLWRILKVSVLSIGWAALIPLILGFVYYNKKDKEKAVVFSKLLYVTVFLAVGLALVLPWSQTRTVWAESLPNIISLQVVMVLIFWFGWHELIKRFGKAGAIVADNKIVVAVLLLLVLMPSIVRSREAVVNWSLRNADYSDRLYGGVLAAVDDKAVITCYTYPACQALIFQQQVKELRSDVTIVPFYWEPGRMVVNFADLYGFNYAEYPYLMFDVVTWNLSKRPVYEVDIFDKYYEFFGIDFGFMSFVPYGYYGQFGRTVPYKDELPKVDYTLSEEIIQANDNPWDLMADRFEADLTKKHSLNAQVYVKMGLRDRAYREMNYASTIIHRFSLEEQKQFLRVREMIESTRESEYYQEGELKSVAYILDSIPELVDVGLLGRALIVARGAVAADPTSVEARLAWADILEKTNQGARAIEEYKNILVLDSENKTALEKLDELQVGIEGAGFETGENDKLY